MVRLPATGLLPIVVLVATELLTVTTSGAATTWTVDTLADEANGCDPGVTSCSLREVVGLATAGDTVAFSVTGTITLTGGQVTVDEELTIAGPGAADLELVGSGSSRLLRVAATGDLTLSGTTLRGGRANASQIHGGALANEGRVAIADAVFTDNRSFQQVLSTPADGGDGGAIHNAAGATLSLLRVRIEGNATGNATPNFQLPAHRGGHGGGIYNAGELALTDVAIVGNLAGHGESPAGSGGAGGGLYTSGNAVLERVTLSGNVSGDGYEPPFSPGTRGVDGSGGGIHTTGTTTLTDVTLSGNAVGLGSDGIAAGGGGLAVAGGTTRLRNVTIAANTASGSGGGFRRGSGTLELAHTLVADNAGAGTADDCGSSFTSLGHNLLGSSASCGSLAATDLRDVATGIGALGDHGGLTETHSLEPGSPAIDAGDPAGCTAWDPGTASEIPLTEDQRGLPRPEDGDLDAVAICDIGAFERRGPFRVTKLADTDDGSCDDDCSLREAVRAANSTLGPDAVELPAGTYVLALAGAGEEAAASGDLDVLDDLVVRGTAGASIVDANGLDRTFDVPTGMPSLTLDGVVLIGGNATDGGGVRTLGGSLVLVGTTLQGNTASGAGGGVRTTGPLTVTSSSFTGNAASTGGGISATGAATISTSTFSGNASSIRGGALELAAAASLLQVTVAGAPGGDGSLLAVDGGALVTLTGTLLADGGCNAISGAIASGGGNLESPAATCGLSGVGDQGGIADAGLAALVPGAAGAPVRPLLAGSPAIDAGPASCPATDQEGAPRPRDGDGDLTDACDVGAVEAPTAEIDLQVTIAGSGTGSVSSNPTGISCPADCTGTWPAGEPVTLAAANGPSSQFTGWSGACAGTNPSCSLTVAAATDAVTATFVALHTLTVLVTGGGQGTVISDPAGISCPGICTLQVVEGTEVTLAATPEGGSSFAEWSGACAGSGGCSVSLDGDRTVGARFVTTLIFADGFETGATGAWTAAVP